jgi:diacylglycerol O-acyltransferase / wax synthase
MQLRTGVAILSYAEDLFFGVLADYEAVADIDALARGIELTVARLVSISKQPNEYMGAGGCHWSPTANHIAAHTHRAPML